MKKIIALAVAASIALTGCADSKSLTVDGVRKNYPTYGWINASEMKSDKVCYAVSTENVILSILLIETLVFPVYFVGFDLYEPIRVKPEDGNCNNF